MKKKNVLVIDAQGGGLGKQLIAGIKKNIPDAHIIAIGTNSTATSAMLKAGADEAATGENSIVVSCRKADVIIGPVGIVIADAMLGEITPSAARAVAQANVPRVLIPFNNCDNYIIGIIDSGMSFFIDNALTTLKKILTEQE